MEGKAKPRVKEKSTPIHPLVVEEEGSVGKSRYPRVGDSTRGSSYKSSCITADRCEIGVASEKERGRRDRWKERSEASDEENAGTEKAEKARNVEMASRVRARSPLTNRAYGSVTAR